MKPRVSQQERDRLVGLAKLARTMIDNLRPRMEEIRQALRDGTATQDDITALTAWRKAELLMLWEAA